MATQRLSATAKVILGMLKLGARTGYDVKTMTDVSTRFFWGASYGQIYPELRRLEDAGLVESEDDPLGSRPRRAFSLTAGGERAFVDWMGSDAPLGFEYRDEGLLKFFFGDAVPHRTALRNVRQLRSEFEERLAHFRTIEARGPTGYPGLALAYGIAFLEFNVRWWRDVESRLAGERAAP